MKDKNLTRRQLLQTSGAVGLAAAIPGSLAAALTAASARQPSGVQKSSQAVSAPSPLKAPASGAINVAFVISKGAVLIDFAGPWEVFQDATIPGRDMMDSAFNLVHRCGDAESDRGQRWFADRAQLHFSERSDSPNHRYSRAKTAASDAMLDWIRKASKTADLTMSVCTGAFVLAATGLLNGKSATTHHTAYTDLAMQYPDIKVLRGARFVEEGNIATAGGLTSGMDLALRTVGRYFGPEAIRRTAFRTRISRQGLDGRRLQLRIRCEAARRRLCGVLDASRPEDRSFRSLQKPDLLLLHGLSQSTPSTPSPINFIELLSKA